MPKAGELNWDDLYKGDVGEPADPRSQPLGYTGPTLKKGEAPPRPTNEQIAKAILAGAPKQPTDEEMFGHLVVSQEQVDKAKDEFENKLNNFFDAARKPLTGQTEVEDEEWANGKSFNSLLSKSELAKRNMFTGE